LPIRRSSTVKTKVQIGYNRKNAFRFVKGPIAQLVRAADS
jgi:hypothetical protein